VSNSKASRFNSLVAQAENCSLCSRMISRRPVLSSLNGNLDSKVVFIAEAPGRLGADKYRIPLYGDQTGRNFERLLDYAGLKRDSVFITNAVLCNPRQENGNNSSPAATEIRNCSHFLNDTIEIINPELIVTLGVRALIALNLILPHSRTLSKQVAQSFNWKGFQVLPLYHPGPMAIISRKLSTQEKDYQKIAEILYSEELAYE